MRFHCDLMGSQRRDEIAQAVTMYGQHDRRKDVQLFDTVKCKCI
jgi:hypothetical protein